MKANQTKALNEQQSGAMRIVDVFEDVFAGLPYADIPAWPPDVFCFVAAVLQQSGAYTRVCSHLKLGVDFTSAQAREKQIEEIGQRWRTSKSPPPLVVKWWNVVKRAKTTSLKKVLANDVLTATLVNLLGYRRNLPGSRNGIVGR